MKKCKYKKEFKREAVAPSNQEGVTGDQVARDLSIDPRILYR